MHRMKIAYGVLFCLLFAVAVYASPQQDEPKSHEGAPAAQQAPETKPEGAEKQEPEKQENAKPENQKDQDRDKQAEQEKDKDQEKNKDNQKEAKPAEKDNGSAREMNGQSGHEMNGQAANAHPAGKSGRIPDDKFRASFGRQHTFHPGRPTMVDNRPGFAYGGYTFELVDAWPAGWAYTDECYVDYIDGQYFLIDLLHPGMRIALFVVM
jgi:hypothetical protein